MSYNTMLEEAICLHNQGKFTEAENLYRQIWEAYPKDANILNLLGLIALEKSAFEEAVNFFYQAKIIAPKMVQIHFNLAYALASWQKPHDAIKEYKAVIALDKTIKEAYNNLGNLYQFMGNSKNAAKVYRKAIKLFPEYSEARANLANLENDIDELKNIAQKYSDEPLAPYFIAKILFNGKKYKSALKFALTAQHLAPKIDDIACLLGQIYAALKQFDLAVSSYFLALELNPKNIIACILLAGLESSYDNFCHAEMHYKQAICINPNSFEAHQNYADMLQKNGRLTEALEEYRKAVILNPKSAETCNNLALVLRDNNEIEEALGLFFNAFLLNPKIKAVSENLSKTIKLYAQTEPEKAKKMAKNWLKKAPDNKQAQNLLQKLS